MELFNAVREVLGMGGDAATVLLAFALWKFDRRLLRLEIKAGKEI
ncbi:hypothetical protein [Magnetovibrio blakemorei]|nr:hypothetical protein [Magnetovibrio blakemorei]